MSGILASGRSARRYLVLVVSVFAVAWTSVGRAQVDVAPTAMPTIAYVDETHQSSYGSRKSYALPPPAALPETIEVPAPTAGFWDPAVAGSDCPSDTGAPWYCPCSGGSWYLPYTGGPWYWQVVPDGLIYRSYLAGLREPRLGSVWLHDDDGGWLWDSTLGGRVGLLRYGTDDGLFPQGWQFDVEGAAFPRLNIEEDRDLESVDFRAGGLLTFRTGVFESKFGYYHLSSHLGDEFLERVPGSQRRNYSRDSLVLGAALRPAPAWRLYGEAGWAFYHTGGAKPWEFQFGAEFSPIEPLFCCGAPFVAVNAHLKEDVNYSGNLSAQAGWQWRGYDGGRLLRIGAQYVNGKSPQLQFFDQFEEQIGMGVWYDY